MDNKTQAKNKTAISTNGMLGEVIKEDDLVINGYDEICKVLIVRDDELVIRRLKDDSVDTVEKRRYKLYV